MNKKAFAGKFALIRSILTFINHFDPLPNPTQFVTYHLLGLVKDVEHASIVL